MGLDRASIAFLIAAKRLGADYESTLTLGRQSLLTDFARLRAAFADNNLALSNREAQELVRAGGGYADLVLERLGATKPDSLDASSYENSTIIHDLNNPLPPELRARFSVVVDGGTLEHVFNYATALAATLEAVQLGGHFIAIAPTNGWFGHGFYQLSPEIFYRTLSPANGFNLRCVLLKAVHWNAKWLQVPDAIDIRTRVFWRSPWPTQLYVLAQRTDILPVLQDPVIQSDYMLGHWEDQPEPARARTVHTPTSALRARMPLALKEIRESYSLWMTHRTSLPAVKLTELP
jgi:hypothetical protein